MHLIRHGPVTVDLSFPSREWVPAPEAAPAIIAVAKSLCGRRRIAASAQPQARATAKLVTGALILPVETRDGLEAHHRLFHRQNASEEGVRADRGRLFARAAKTVFGSARACAGPKPEAGGGLPVALGCRLAPFGQAATTT